MVQEGDALVEEAKGGKFPRPLRLAIVEGLNVSDRGMGNIRPRYNAAPSAVSHSGEP
jgi:hypothetical protein